MVTESDTVPDSQQKCILSIGQSSELMSPFNLSVDKINPTQVHPAAH